MLLTLDKLRKINFGLAKTYHDDQEEVKYRRTCETCDIDFDANKSRACGGCINSPMKTFYCVSVQRSNYIND
jgi:hypothetical protein